MAQLILTIGGTKGGSGKSTHALHAAIQAAIDGKRVVLVDTDEQASSYDYTLLRDPELPAYTCVQLSMRAGLNVRGFREQLLRQAASHDIAIIDAGGADSAAQRTALVVSDVIAVPVVPSQIDVMALDTTAALVEEARSINPDLIAYCFLNGATPHGQGSDNEATAGIIRENAAFTYLDAPIRAYKAYRHAAATGIGVMELKRPHRNEEAISDLATLHRTILQNQKKGISSRAAK